MKNLFYLLAILLIIVGCKKTNDTPANNYDVKYFATWQGFELATCYYHQLSYRIGDSTVTSGPFTLKSNGTFTYEYKAKLHDTLKITFSSYQPFGSTHYDTLKIFYNGGLVQIGKDSCIYIINQ
jgi:hypothetical protein